MSEGILREPEVPGVLLRITDPARQVYLQSHPFASGPDPEMNKLCRQAISRSLETRPAGQPARTRALREEEINLAPEEQSRLDKMLDKLGMPQPEKQKLLKDYTWKVAFIARQNNSVLVIGCGSGEELLFIRSVLPSASITAIDFKENLRPDIKDLLKVNFICGNVYEYLEGVTASFDLVYSNHVLEHMYDPEAILRLCVRVSKSLVSALPMDGAKNAVFAERILRLAKNSTKSLDFIMLDAGHPWKTNEADLTTTLTRAGYSKIKLFIRQDHISRTFSGGRQRFEVQKLLGCGLNSLILGTMRNIMKVLFAKKMPEAVIRLWFAVENRLWFGSNQLKNRFAPEVLMVADKEGG